MCFCWLSDALLLLIVNQILPLVFGHAIARILIGCQCLLTQRLSAILDSVGGGTNFVLAADWVQLFYVGVLHTALHAA